MNKYEILIERGYTCNPKTGDVFGPNGTKLQAKSRGYVIGATSLTKNGVKKTINFTAHQFIYYYVNRSLPEAIDHINGVRDDNRLDNLRGVTHQQNHFNRTKSKGYYYNKNNKKFHSTIKVNNKSIHLGYFNTEEEAKQAYLDAKKEYHTI